MADGNPKIESRLVKVAALAFAALESLYGYTHQQVSELVMDERDAQDNQWGGRVHDSEHNAWDWFHYIENQIAKSRRDRPRGNRTQ